MATITAANSIVMLGIRNLYPVAQQIQGFSVDDVFTSEALERIETMMGVDGRLSAGWVATAKKFTISLQADSPSNDIFDSCYAAEEIRREPFEWFGELSLPSIGRIYTLTQGYLSNNMPIPEVKKVLQPRKFTMTWASIQGARIPVI